MKLVSIMEDEERKCIFIPIKRYRVLFIENNGRYQVVEYNTKESSKLIKRCIHGLIHSKNNTDLSYSIMLSYVIPVESREATDEDIRDFLYVLTDIKYTPNKKLIEKSCLYLCNTYSSYIIYKDRHRRCMVFGFGRNKEDAKIDIYAQINHYRFHSREVQCKMGLVGLIYQIKSVVYHM